MAPGSIGFKLVAAGRWEKASDGSFVERVKDGARSGVWRANVRGLGFIQTPPGSGGHTVWIGYYTAKSAMFAVDKFINGDGDKPALKPHPTEGRSEREGGDK